MTEDLAKTVPPVARITLARCGKCFAVERDETILEAALRNEIWLPHACRGGSCGTCRAIVVAGTVNYDSGSPAGLRRAASSAEALLCCAKPLGDVTLDVAELAARPVAARYRRPVQRFDPAALQAMMQYSWPGNVRELEHTIERAVLMSRTADIQPADLSLSSPRAQTQNLEDLSLEAVEAVLVRKALQRFQGNVSQAAEALGLSRGALYRRMEKYGL